MRVLVAEQLRNRSMDSGFYILKADSIDEIQEFLGGYFRGGLGVFEELEIADSKVPVTSHGLADFNNGHVPNAAPMFLGVHTPIYADTVIIPEDQEKADEVFADLVDILCGEEMTIDDITVIEV